MDQHIMKLVTSLAVFAVILWVVASITGMREQMTMRKHPSQRKMDPNSPVWQNSGVRGPLATSGGGVL